MHLALLRIQFATEHRTHVHKVLAQVVYRCDAESQFDWLDHSRSVDDGAKYRARRRAARTERKDVQPLTFDRVLGRAVINNFREVCSSAAVYSLLVSAFGQLSEAAACLSTATARLAQAECVEEGSVLEEDVHACGILVERQAASASVQHDDRVFSRFCTPTLGCRRWLHQPLGQVVGCGTRT
jgi:hypothetical protein